MCLYELGVLDNGNIIGLVYEEMTESLQTLGRMLGGLGGGEIKITRVIRVGSTKRDDRTGSESDSGGDSSEGGSISTSSSYPFQSYRVDDSSPELEMHNTLTPLRPPVPSPMSVALAIPPISKQQLLREHHNRSAAEKAFDKDSKREKRRQFRRGGEVDAVPFDYVQRAKEKAAYRLLHPKVIPIRQPPKVIKQPYVKPPQVSSKFKPEMMLAEGQVRYVVEAQVTKRIQSVVGRDSQEESEDSDGITDAHSGEEEQEEDEGWNFLEFDFMAAQKRGTDGSP